MKITVELPLSDTEAERQAAVFKAAGHAERWQILTLLRSHGELCVLELAQRLPLAQPTISHHLRILAEAGLISRRKERRKSGSYHYYTVCRKTVNEAQELLTGLLK